MFPNEKLDNATSSGITPFGAIRRYVIWNYEASSLALCKNSYVTALACRMYKDGTSMYDV